MAVERTLSIIKPDAVAKNVIGEIYTRFERAGLKIVAAKMTWLARPDAEGFYAVHRERPFFKDLVEFMTSGPAALAAFFAERGEKPFRARQTLRWIHHRLAARVDAMTDLAGATRNALARDAEIRTPAVVRDTVASDGTRKWLLDVGSANAIET